MVQKAIQIFKLCTMVASMKNSDLKVFLYKILLLRKLVDFIKLSTHFKIQASIFYWKKLTLFHYPTGSAYIYI